MATVLITGGSGLIGKRLTEILLLKGYSVIHLSRKAKPNAKVPVFVWDVKKQTIDINAIKQADYIVHLAGAGVAEKRWTKKRKQEITDSRVQSANLLFKTLQQNPHHVKAIVSSSAIGYYGNKGEDLLREDVTPANDFLAGTCVLWENSVKQFDSINIREARLRIGIVLAREGGALPELVTPVRFCVAPLFNGGKPYYSWIHLEDLCRLFLYAVETDSVKGAYNAVAPNPIRFKGLMNAIRQKVNRFSIPIPVPSFALQLLVGEMSETLIASANVSNDKIRKEGFQFQFDYVKEAIENLLS